MIFLHQHPFHNLCFAQYVVNDVINIAAHFNATCVNMKHELGIKKPGFYDDIVISPTHFIRVKSLIHMS